MRRAITGLICLWVLLAGTVAFAAGISSAKTGAPPTLAANEAAAKADAAKLLSEVTLPAGAQRLSAEPAGDNGYLKPLPHLSANPGYVDTEWWSVAASTPAQVIATAQASPPPGVQSTGTSGGGNARTGTMSTGVTFFLADVTGVLESRMVEVTATALPGGATGVMVQTQSQWVVPRAAASNIPAGTRVINVRETTVHGKVVRSATITAASRIRATVGYFDGLASVQPGTVACPAEFVPTDVLTVSFLHAAAAAPLATAQFSGDFNEPGSGVSSECNAVLLKVGTEAQVGLLGGDYIASINRLLGTHIP